MYRLLALLGLGVIAMVAAPQESAAQMCDFCRYEGEMHYFTGNGCSGQGGCKDCSHAPEGHIGCHALPADGPCYTHRLLCDPAMALQLPEDEAILTVLAARDIDGATELLRSGGVQFNVERRALQMLGCKGAVISHIPIDGSFFADLMASVQQQVDLDGASQ